MHYSSLWKQASQNATHFFTVKYLKGTFLDVCLLSSLSIFGQSNPSASHHYKFYNIFRTSVADVLISYYITVGVWKLIWHLSPENVKTDHINKRKREILTTCSVSQWLIWMPYKGNVSTSRQRTMSSMTAAINNLRKVCLEIATPTTWIHFNGRSGHICSGISNPLWVTLTYDIWTESKF